jgi:hypothetical protein
METRQARRVQVGDVAVYKRARHRIVAVHDQGFWAPYFELEGAGVVGHALVDSVEIQPIRGVQDVRGPRRGASGARVARAGALVMPELGIQF